MKDNYTIDEILKIEHSVKSKEEFNRLSILAKFALIDRYLFRYSFSEEAASRENNTELAEALSDWFYLFCHKALPKVYPLVETNVKYLDDIANVSLPADSDPWEEIDSDSLIESNMLNDVLKD